MPVRARDSNGGMTRKRSEVPGGRYPTEGVAIQRNPADGWEGQVGSHEEFTRSRCFLQQANPDANRLFRVMFETIVPVGVVEADREQGVPGECQPLAAGRHMDNGMS